MTNVIQFPCQHTVPEHRPERYNGLDIDAVLELMRANIERSSGWLFVAIDKDDEEALHVQSNFVTKSDVVYLLEKAKVALVTVCELT